MPEQRVDAEAQESGRSGIRGIVWLWVSLVVVIADQMTKLWALDALGNGEVISVIPGFFNFVLAFNYGAAFSFLGDAGGWQVWFFTILALGVSAVLVVWLYRLPAATRWTCLSIALIIGGAIGNVIDRLRLGYVVDFIDWYAGSYHWPTFNIADSAICVGAVLFLIAGFVEKDAV